MPPHIHKRAGHTLPADTYMQAGLQQSLLFSPRCILLVHARHINVCACVMACSLPNQTACQPADSHQIHICMCKCACIHAGYHRKQKKALPADRQPVVPPPAPGSHWYKKMRWPQLGRKEEKHGVAITIAGKRPDLAFASHYDEGGDALDSQQLFRRVSPVCVLVGHCQPGHFRKIFLALQMQATARQSSRRAGEYLQVKVRIYRQ